MSKHVRRRASKSMRIKAVYPGLEALCALWSSLPHSLYLATLTLSWLYSTWAQHGSLHSLSLPAASPAPPGSLIKGWVEGSTLRRWPPAEACSLILKGRHVGSPPPSPPTPSPQLPPPAWPVQCALCGQPEAAFRSPSFPFPFSLLRPPKMRSALPNGTRLGGFTLER